MSSDGQYCADQLNLLSGWIFTKAGADPEGFPFMELENPKGQGIVRVYFSQDPEGNGPGWADIAGDLPKKKGA